MDLSEIKELKDINISIEMMTYEQVSTYVDETAQDLSNYVDDSSEKLSGYVNQKASDVSVSILDQVYLKNETSSANQISEAFSKISKTSSDSLIADDSNKVWKVSNTYEYNKLSSVTFSSNPQRITTLALLSGEGQNIDGTKYQIIGCDWKGGGLYGSNNGTEWTRISLPANKNGKGFGVVQYINGEYVLVDNEGIYYHTPYLSCANWGGNVHLSGYNNQTVTNMGNFNVCKRIDDHRIAIGKLGGKGGFSLVTDFETVTAVYNNIGGNQVNGMSLLPDGSFFVATGGGVFKSTDVNGTYTRMNIGAGSAWNWMDVLYCKDLDTVIAGGDGGDNQSESRRTDIWYSTDRGSTWLKASLLGYYDYYTTENLIYVDNIVQSIDEYGKIVLYAITRLSKSKKNVIIFKSYDGKIWNCINTFTKDSEYEIRPAISFTEENKNTLIFFDGDESPFDLKLFTTYQINRQTQKYEIQDCKDISNYVEPIKEELEQEIYQNNIETSGDISTTLSDSIATVKNNGNKDQAAPQGTLLPLSSITNINEFSIQTISVDSAKTQMSESVQKYCHIFKYNGNITNPDFNQLNLSSVHIATSTNSNLLTATGSTLFQNVYKFDFDTQSINNYFLSSDSIFVGFSTLSDTINVSSTVNSRLGLAGTDTSNNYFTYTDNTRKWSIYTVGMKFDLQYAVKPIQKTTIIKLLKDTSIYTVEDLSGEYDENIIKFDFSDLDSTKTITFEVLFKNPDGVNITFDTTETTYIDVGGEFKVEKGNTLCTFRTFDGGNTVLRNTQCNWNNWYKYRFSVFADIHLTKNSSFQNYLLGDRDFTMALSSAKDIGVDFGCIIGDVSHGENNDYEVQKKMYRDCILSSGVNFPLYACKGNHDHGYTLEQWKEMMSCDFDYSFTYDGDLFIFLSKPYKSGTDPFEYEPYALSTLNFLSSTLNENPNKRAFIFMHYPLNSQSTQYQYPGLADYNASSSALDSGRRVNGVYSWGFKLSANTLRNEQNEFVLKTLSSYSGSTIVFNGHTHMYLSADQQYPNINFYKPYSNVALVHTPSLNEPRNEQSLDYFTDYPLKQPVQGYIVEVGDSKIKINGYEFNTREKGYNCNYMKIRTYTV